MRRCTASPLAMLSALPAHAHSDRRERGDRACRASARASPKCAALLGLLECALPSERLHPLRRAYRRGRASRRAYRPGRASRRAYRRGRASRRAYRPGRASRRAYRRGRAMAIRKLCRHARRIGLLRSPNSGYTGKNTPSAHRTCRLDNRYHQNTKRYTCRSHSYPSPCSKFPDIRRRSCKSYQPCRPRNRRGSSGRPRCFVLRYRRRFEC